jgi:hypothetical protein
MVSVLGEAGYMDWSSTAADLRRTKAEWLLREGLDYMSLSVLWRQAQHEASSNARGLFACWMKEAKRLHAALDRMRRRTEFGKQAVKDVRRDEQRRQQDEDMAGRIHRLTDWRKASQ